MTQTVTPIVHTPPTKEQLRDLCMALRASNMHAWAMLVAAIKDRQREHEEKCATLKDNTDLRQEQGRAQEAKEIAGIFDPSYR